MQSGARAFVSYAGSMPVTRGTACRGETSSMMLLPVYAPSRHDKCKGSRICPTITSAVACAARRASTGGAEWKEQLSELFSEESGRKFPSRKKPRTQEGQEGLDSSYDSAPQHETVEEVFGLESGWSVEVLGDDDGDDEMMLIGSEVQPSTETCSAVSF